MKIVDKIQFIKSVTILIVGLILSITMLLTLINFCKYPEKYLTTWRYQLEQELAAGNQEAIDYYKNVYIANGQTLWD